MKNKILIDIDLVRNWYSSLVITYIKQIDDWEGDLSEVKPQDLWKYFKFPIYECKVDYIVDTNEDGEEYHLEEVSNEINHSKPYEINEKYFNEFLLSNVSEIFGAAIEMDKGIINYINTKIHEGLDITFFSTSKGKAKPSTLFFLAKYACEVNTILFVNSVSDIPDLKSYTLLKSNYSFINNVKVKELDFKNLK